MAKIFTPASRHRKIKTRLKWYFGPLLPIFLEALHESAASCGSSSVREESITRATTMIVCVAMYCTVMCLFWQLSAIPCAHTEIFMGNMTARPSWTLIQHEIYESMIGRFPNWLLEASDLVISSKLQIIPRYYWLGNDIS